MSLFKNPQFTSRKLKDESYPPGTTAVWHVGRGKLTAKNGFTLIELLGSLAIIAVLVTIIFTSMSSFRNSKALQTVSEDVLSLLDEAKNNTLSAKDNYSYGVHFESAKMVLFRAPTYSGLEVTNKKVDVDNAVQIYSIVLAGGGPNVIFQKLTGKTSQNGTVIIRLKSDNSKTKTIVIAESGVASSN